MFFKKAKKVDMVSADYAFVCVFVYWSVCLLVDSILDVFDRSLGMSSFMLLVSGLAIFFVSERVFTYIRKAKRSSRR